jgi:hypothetical protein
MDGCVIVVIGWDNGQVIMPLILDLLRKLSTLFERKTFILPEIQKDKLLKIN